MPAPLLIAYAGLFGLVVGSFLNVVIHRIPRGSSVISPRSSCPFCSGSIAIRDNVPILSYLLLRGRCRTCGAPISARYPIVELTTGLLFGACAWRFGWTWQTPAAAIFCALLLVLAMIDFDHFLLPDKITMPGILLGLGLQPFLPQTSFVDALLGVLFGAGALILVINFWYWLRAEEGMGLGDVNMLAMIGAFLGWKGAAVSLLLATVVGAVTGVTLVAFRSLGAKSRLPFGVFLSIGALIALFFGARIASFYTSLL